MLLIDQLKEAGYDVALSSNGNLKLTWTGDGEPKPARVKPLLEQLSKNKARALAWLMKDTWRPPKRCQCCKDNRFWFSVYGATVCEVCHPPAVERLVLSRSP